MPKMKTNRAAAKRFKFTGTGKIKRRHANLRHILVNKTRKQKRRLGKSTIVDKTNERVLKALLPYGRD
jgi:large subunit ribosomal protein L35